MPAEAAPWMLPGGTLRNAQLQRLLQAEHNDQLVAALPTAVLRTKLAPALTAGPTPVARVLKQSLTRRAMRLWYTGDPLGIALPAAYIWAKIAEAANVRLVAHAVTGELDAARAEEELILWPNSS